jgi:tetratricopeptide (TPR) repeat protein
MTQLAQNPRDPAVFDGLGDAYFAIGNYPEAEKQYTAARDLKFSYAPFDLGRAFEAQHKYDQAAQTYVIAVQQKSTASRAALRLFNVRVHDAPIAAKAELETTAAALDRSDPLYPLVELYLGRRTLAQIPRGSDTDPCAFDYYSGLWSNVQSDKESAIRAFKDAQGVCGKSNTLYDDAMFVLKQLT